MRTKIIAGNLLTVLMVGFLSFFMVKSNVEQAFVQEVDGRITNDFHVVSRSIALRGRELQALVEQQANQRAMQDIFGALDEGGRRQRGFEASQRVATWLGDPARGQGGRPDISAVIDDTGRVIARDSDINAMFGTDLRGQIAAIGPALQGTATVDVWASTVDNKAIQVAVAPIRSDEGRILGAVLVGYDLSNGLAVRESELVGREVGFVWGDRLYSSSLDQGQPEQLSAFLFGAGQATTVAARDAGTESGPFIAMLGSDEYIGVVGPLTSSGAHVAMVVIGNRSAQLSKASPANLILMLTLFGAVVVIAYGFVMGSTILRPIAQLEEGILQVINGRTETRLDVQGSDFGGLSYRINQLLNLLTGTPEASESGAVGGGGKWDDQGAEGTSTIGTAIPTDATAPAGDEPEADPATAALLLAEGDDAYYARVYAEYVAAKQSVGENVSNIAQEKFVQRLRGQEQALLAKRGCRLVRFQVQTRGTQVNLTPIIVR